jgi:DNA-binding NarL/FixJ family response regulator
MGNMRRSQKRQGRRRKHSSVQPHVTVMDFNMPVLNGLDASRAIFRKCPKCINFVADNLRFGPISISGQEAWIRGFCSKVQIDGITEAIKALLRGESYFPESFAASTGD